MLAMPPKQIKKNQRIKSDICYDDNKLPQQIIPQSETKSRGNYFENKNQPPVFNVVSNAEKKANKKDKGMGTKFKHWAYNYVRTA